MQGNAAEKLKGEPSRGPHSYLSHPKVEAIKINAGLASPEASLMIVADGKQLFFSLTRKQLFGLHAETAVGLHNMEPGK